MKFFQLILTATFLLCSCRHGGKVDEQAQQVDTGGATRFVIKKEEGFTRVAVKDPWQNSHGRITSYNVCYTKLLRDSLHGTEDRFCHYITT